MKILVLVLSLLLISGPPAIADELTRMIEQELDRLGYETGEVDGEETLETTIAISKFQAENDLEVNGEVSGDLLRALVTAPAAGEAATPVSAGSATDIDPAALQAAREACLQEKAAAARDADKKRGFKRLIGAIARTASRTGNVQVLENLHEIYNASATADDIAAIAGELGITEEDVLACGAQVPSQTSAVSPCLCK